MAPQNETRPLGAGSMTVVFLAGMTTADIPQKTQPFKSNLARGIKPLGPAALGYLFCDLAAGKSFWPAVEAYAALSPYRDFILANTGVRPLLRALDGERTR
jgi:hypothetical protein